jgi:hypothetical protein
MGKIAIHLEKDRRYLVVPLDSSEVIDYLLVSDGKPRPIGKMRSSQLGKKLPDDERERFWRTLSAAHQSAPIEPR